MKTEVHRRPFGTMESPRFVVMLSCMNGAILLGRHEGRDTWRRRADTSSRVKRRSRLRAVSFTRSAAR